METWQEAFDALRSGEADLIPNQGITERRLEWFAFSLPVETFPVSIFTRAHESGISSLSTLTGRKPD
jgi:ABC-type amino acid transport substrate-binding protein